MKIVVINLTKNDDIFINIKEYLSSYEVVEYSNTEEYNKHLSSFQIYPYDYENFNFDDYKNTFELVLFITNGTKRKIKNNLIQDSFIPIKVFVINQNKNLEQQLKAKIVPADFQWFYDKFISKFYLLLKEHYPNNDNFSQIIKKCPFCQDNKFFFTHDYSKNNTTCVNIDFKCKSCENILNTEIIMKVIDVVYRYNPKIETYLNEYVKISTKKKIISDKIENEIAKNETVSYNSCI